MEQPEHKRGQDLESRVYQLERDLIDAYARIGELELHLLSLEQVKIARCELYTEVMMEKVDAIGDTLKQLISDLIAEDKEREKVLPTPRKIKIIRRQRLTPLSQETEMIDEVN